MKHVALIVNPRAGRNRGIICGRKAQDCLDALGCRTELHQTRSPGDATDLARHIASRCDVLFSVGGDGTLTEVVSGLAAPSAVPVAIIPVGTANVVARELKIPLKNPEAAVRAALEGRPQAFDLPQVKGRPFLANVGAGFDADVVHLLHAHRQSLPGDRPISMASYLPLGLKALIRHTPATLNVSIDGEALGGFFADVVVCNTANYGGVMRLTPKARPGDGLLDVYLRRRCSRAGILRHLASGLTGWKDGSAVQRLRGRNITISSMAPVAVQVDGDPAGETPVDISIGTGKLTILAP